MTQNFYNNVDEEIFIFPTSYAQQRLWFLDQFAPNSPFYNIPSAVRFKGKLNVAALEQSINEIIRRHETLRTTFATVDGQPVQVINPSATIDMPKVDLLHLPSDQKLAEAIRLATLDARTPFDLSQGPLIRVTLLQLDQQDHIVLLNMHHIISDGWSMGVLIREIAVLYNAFLNRQPSPLPELPIQYADFAQWQQEWLTGEVLEKQISYWKDKLNTNLPVLELPTDRSRPAVQTLNGDNYHVLIPKKLGDSLKALSRQEDVTLFMTLIAAFKVLLYRYTGQQDLCVGSPIANRTRAEIEGLIGFFVNTIVLRTNLSGDITFSQLLKRVREITLEAYANQDVPFERLVEILQTDRDMSHSSLFQVMFILQNNPMEIDMELPDISISTMNVNAGTSTFDLTLMITEDVAGLQVSVEFNTDLFNRSTIVRMLEHYQMLLTSIVANPNQKISQLPMLSQSERQQLLVEWNKTSAAYPSDLCIHQLFELQAEQTPDAEAVVFENQRLNYDQLNRRTNQLAHYLQKLGVGPGTVVGICNEKSSELIISVMATLKAGGTFLPIDPTYPAERITHILEDSNVPVMLIQTKIIADLPAHSARIIDLDSDRDRIELESDQNPTSDVTPDHLAYIIYTSGSTGKAKGVMVPHRSVVNQYFAWEAIFQLRSKATSHLQMASFSFDVFCGDFVRALCSGGKLVLCSRDLLLEADKLYSLMTRENINCAEFVPAVLRNLAQYLEKTNQNLAFMKVLIAGSDIWYVGEYQKFLQFCGPNTRLLNTFGLTEATIDSSYFEGSKMELSVDRVVPIGRPFNNTRIYILDKNFEPLPIGISGELCVGGDGVTYGYLNRPDMTAEKFIPNPFNGASGDRLYRTGDRARFLPDGNIEFLGRMDDQVKIRGYRIELGEIEAALGKYPDVKEIAVVVHGNTAERKRLVAYIVSNNGVQPSPSELRNFMKSQLPEYMVPSFFVVLDQMPLTPNGKIDRQALPAPDQDASSGFDTNCVAPRTKTEEVIAEIWTKILGVETIGIFNNFFELGGHSLLATQVVSRLREAFKLDLPLRKIFESPTVAELAEFIDNTTLTEKDLQRPPITPVDRDQELPLSYAQQRLWFLDQFEPNSPFYNIPNAVRLHGELNIEVFRKSINEIVRRHESLRTNFLVIDGKPKQVIAPCLTIPMKLIDLTTIPPPEQIPTTVQLSLLEAQQPFDLSHGTLLRVTVVRLGNEDHIVLITMHHIISDEWSIQVFTKEISILYDAYIHGRSSPLPELPIQYADFAYWQQQWLQGEVLQNQLNYWKNQLAGSPPLLELPTDRPRPAVQTYNGDFKSFYFSESLSKSIKALCHREGTTLFMTLLAGFQTLLYRYSGQTDICVGTPIANRTQGETESLIGFFVNTLVLRNQLSDQMSFHELLKQVKEASLGAYMHQDLPFEKLVDALQLKRDTSHSPLFQVMFALQNVPTESQEISVGLTASTFETHVGSSKFDMTLFMQEDSDRIGGALEYNIDLFDTSTIEQMLIHFQNILQTVVENSEQTISEIDILTATERQQLLFEWNNTTHVMSDDLCIHQRFEKQVTRSPLTPAVIHLYEQLSYQHLNRKANQVAHYLRALDVKPGDLVGIYMDRSLEMVIAIFAIWKAGAAYVPLDPGYPADRISFIIQDARLSLVLTQQSLRSNLAGETIKLINLDEVEDAIVNYSDQNPESNTSIENLAYVIYTSGTTGKPKGVMVSHLSALNLWAGLKREIYDHLPQCPLRVSLNAPIMFDASVQQLVALLEGNTLCIIPQDIRIDGFALLNYIGEHRIDVFDCVPSQLKLLIEAGLLYDENWKPSAMLPGGEAIDEVTWQQLSSVNLPGFFNMYGPTECTVDSTICFIQRHPSQVSIGRPIVNTTLYVLDRQMKPVPLGVIGELYIGGKGLAHGYLNRPELTAEKFVPHPFSADAGARLYRTGDLVRYLKDGNLIFLGRVDHQVKVRGFRIELGEIEAVLSQHPAVRELVVVVKIIQQSGASQLVAYIVPENETLPSINELRDFLKEKLPEYMVPTAFIKLDALPRTPNGKIDRLALPDVNIERPDLENIYVAPRTQTEQKLVEIWRQVTGIEKIGIHDNFFELGGDSILSIQVISRANQAGIHITPKQIFQYPTIAGLAAVANIDNLIQADQGRIAGSVLLTPIQHWFFQQNPPEPYHWNQTIMFSIRHQLNLNLLKSALRLLLIHHDALRLRFEKNESGWHQINADFDDKVPLSWIDISNLADNDMPHVIESISNSVQTGLHLTDGPLIRMIVIFTGENKSARLLIVAHHLVIDTVSWQILLEDLHSIYLQLSEGQSGKLPAKTTAFKYWSERLFQHAQSEQLHQEVDYWLQFEDANPEPIPIDFPDGMNTEASADLISRSLTTEETRLFLYNIPSTYRVQMNDVLLTALALTFRDRNLENSFLIELERHGREHIFDDVDLSRTVGWFTTLVPVRLSLESNASYIETLKSIQEQIRTIPNNGIGFGLLKYLSGNPNITEQMNRIAQPEIVFNYFGQLDQALTNSALFEPAAEATGSDRSLLGKRSHIIEINASVVAGQLQMGWLFSRNLHKRETIERFADQFMEKLNLLIRHYQSDTEISYKTSDFQDFEWSQDDLLDIVTEISRLEG